MTHPRWKPQQAALLRRRRSLLAPMFGDDCGIATASGADYQAWISPADRQRLAAVYEALDRIDRGNYGLCTGCGAAIDRVRLESIPWVRRCVVCEDRQGHAEQELEAA